MLSLLLNAVFGSRTANGFAGDVSAWCQKRGWACAPHDEQSFYITRPQSGVCLRFYHNSDPEIYMVGATGTWQPEDHQINKAALWHVATVRTRMKHGRWEHMQTEFKEHNFGFTIGGMKDELNAATFGQVMEAVFAEVEHFEALRNG